MHKGVIILTKAESREEALENVNDFMEPYGEGNVWDWFSIGNRWHNTLAPIERKKEFHKKAVELYPVLEGYYAINDIENDEVRPVLQKLWEDMGLRGKNPYWSSYGFEVTDTEEDYNVVPLSECLDIVKSWVRDTEKEAEEYFEKIVEEREKEKAQPEKKFLAMSAYYAGLYKDAKYNNFCFDSNVYNATTGGGESIPEDIDGYWAVMVDMHN